MAFSVQMPELGESVTEGTVTRWLKQEGDEVAADEPLLEISTDKVDTEIPSPVAGVLQRIVVAEDETVDVGVELAVIDDGSGGDGAPAEQDEAEPAREPEPEPEPAATEAESEAEPEAEPEPEPEPAREREAVSAAEAAEAADIPAAETKPAASGGTAVVMPEVGESVTEGVVTRWLKAVGDEVALDEPLLEISTDKVDTEVPSPVAGTLLEITAAEDETVEVGGQLAVIGDAGAAAEAEPQSEPEPEPKAEPEPQPEPEPEPEQKSEPEPEQKSEPEPARAEAAPEPEQKQPEPAAARTSGSPWTEPERPSGGGRTPKSGADRSSDAEQAPTPEPAGNGGAARDSAPYVTPLVRKLAAEQGVDLAQITGTGVGGRIRKQDVLAAAEQAAAEKAAELAPEPEPAGEAEPAAAARPAAGTPKASAEGPQPGTTVKMPRLRQVIAQRMTESLRVSAQLTTVQEVDVTRIARLRARAKGEFERREGLKLTFLPFFAKAAVEALKQFPQVNASIDEESKQIIYHGAVHLAIAVDTPRGLLVPVVRDADDLNIAGLAKRINDLAARTRDNKVTPDELGGGTFTITNIGSVGALFDTPIINQPQVAILGTGAITKQPVVVTGPDGEDTIAIRSVCYLPLTYDHRLVDGADAGRFVAAIKSRLEEGAFEADLGL